MRIKLFIFYPTTKMKGKKFKLISKGNGRNYLAYMQDGSIQEAIKISGFFFLARLGSDFKLIPKGEHLRQKDFILVE